MNDNGILSSSSEYKNGSMLNKIEYCISTGDNSCNSSTYLLIPSSYWTLTGNNASRYYINNASGIQTQSDSMSSNVRVTEFVKSNVEVSGNDYTFKNASYSSFNVGFYYQGVGGIWYVNPKENDLYYSTSDTDKFEVLKPFTSTISGGLSDSRYYIYQKQ